MVIKELFEKLRGTTLYFPGDHVQFKLKYEYNNYKEIMKRLGIKHVEMNNFVTSGIDAYEAGHLKVAKEIAQKNSQRFTQRGIRKIITNCPSSYYMFKEVYPKLITGWDIEVEHISETILTILQKKQLKEATQEAISYNDSAYIQNQNARSIINKFSGEIIEPQYTKQESFCCAGHGGVHRNYPELAKKINKKRITEFPQNAQKIITPSAICYTELREFDERITEFSTYVLGKLRGNNI